MEYVSLVSGGIDSPVAAYVMASKGYGIVAAHASISKNPQKEKIGALVRRVEEASKTKIKTYIIPFNAIQEEIARKCNRRFQCLLCKRMMYRAAEKIAQKEKALGIVTGDSIGQVASQTLQNLMVESASINFPVIRPLIGFDKNDTIEIARKIGTFDISIKDAVDCPFVPKRPSTAARIEDVINEENKIDATWLVREALENATRL